MTGAVWLVALVSAATLAGSAPASSRGPQTHATSEPCIGAVVEHEVRSDDADGVRRELRFQDRFYRCDGRAWTERVRPAALSEHGRDGRAHRREMPPLHRLARLVERDGDGARLALVGREDALWVDVDPASFEAVGFDGRWDRAAELVGADVRRALSCGPPSSDGRVVCAGRTPRGDVRLVWSAALAVAIELEVRRPDGTASERIVLREVSAPPHEAPPWAALAHLPRKDYADFED